MSEPIAVHEQPLPAVWATPPSPTPQDLAGTLLDLVVETDGRVTLPPWLARALQLAPGELLALAPGPVSLGLALYREFLADDWSSVPDPIRRQSLQEFLSRPLVAVEEGGVLAIPPELFPLRPGDRVCLQVLSRDLTHELFLFREEAILPETAVRETAD